ncbi:MAG: hypothetical protein QNJ84_14025 [Alphaproteobacteria bacterium]|nr:hypothetical protein [Alphaproteobacteria bacterium]
MRSAGIGLLAGAALLMSSPSTAQSICGPHEDIIKKLETTYKETEAGVGLATGGGVVQLYVSEGGSWTVLVTRPNGVTCLVAGGQNWEIVEPRFLDVKEKFS